MQESESPLQASPLSDSNRWQQLLEEVGVDSLLVVIEREMGVRLKAHTSAEDIWMLALQQAWRDRNHYQWSGLPKFRSWLLTIARNRLRDEVDRLDAEKRLDGRAKKFSDLPADADGSISALLPSITATPARMAYYKERARIMADALAALSPEHEPIVRRYLFEQEPMEAITQSLGIPVSTGWNRFRKGSALYAKRLKELLSISGSSGN